MKPLVHMLLALGFAMVAGRADPPAVLRVAGNAELGILVSRWAAAFVKEHPEASVVTHLTGSDTGIAALYTGRTDVALLGRAPTAAEIQAFEWIFRYKPAQMEILTGSLDRPGRSPALVVFVHRDNPLAQLTLEQLAAVFGAAGLGSRETPCTWSQLGLGGTWADRPIHLYSPDAMSGTGRYFRHVVLDDSRMMNWAQLTEFHDSPWAGRETHDAGRQIIASLAEDRYGLAVASLGFDDPRVRALPLAGTAAEVAVTATRASVAGHRYPLTRSVVACYQAKPGSLPSPLVREFLRYILNHETPPEIVPEDGYLPLAPNRVAEELRRLD